MIKRNKLFAVFGIMFAFLTLISITACKKDNEIEVTGFSPLKTNYAEGEEMGFIITLNNPNDYDVVSCKINDKSFTTEELSLTTEKYNVNTTFTYSSDSDVYTLQEITYVKDGTSETMSVNKKATSRGELTSKNDIKVTELKVSSVDNDEVFANDNCQAVITVNKNASDIKILTVYLKFEDVNGKIETIKKSIIDDGKSNVYTIKFVMPLMTGAVSTSVSDIDYVKKTEFYSISQNDVVEQLMVAIHDVEVEPSGTRLLANGEIKEDVNEQYYFDSSSSIDIQITLKNKSNLNVESIKVSGQNININEGDITLDSGLLEKMIIRKTINLDPNVSPLKLTLDSITYTKDGNSRTIGETLLDDDFYYYNKIIKSASDFNNMIVDATTKKITGRYILANDITLTGSEKYLFKDYAFAGTLECNGYTISSSVINTKPMFEKTIEGSIIQNAIINYSTVNAPMICEGNYGNIFNMKLTGTISTGKKTISKEVQSGLCGFNALAGKIRNIEFSVQLEGENASFAVIEENFGEYKNIIINPNSITLANNILLALPVYNKNGKVESAIVLVKNWFDSIDPEDNVSLQNELYVLYTEGGTYRNIIVNSEFNKTIDNYNTIIYGPEKPNASTIVGMVSKAFFEIPELITGIFDDTSYWKNYVDSTFDSDFSSKAKEIGENSLNNNYYLGLGFVSYSESNNSFWKIYNNGTATLKFR